MNPRVAVFFGDWISAPVRAADLARLLAPLGRGPASRAAARLRAGLRRHPGTAVISVRDLFTGEETFLRDRARKAFRAAGCLQRLGKSTAAAAAARPIYGGALPSRIPGGALFRLFRAMNRIRTTAAAVLEEGLAVSSTHVVISRREGRWMTITATDTDKHRVAVYSHTPLVQRRGGRFVFYGDPHHLPSSETESHWYLHQALTAWKSREGAALLHIHHPGLRESASDGVCHDLGGQRIVGMEPRTYGSREQGEAMAALVRRHRAGAVTLCGHGTWFYGATVTAALVRARKMIRSFSLTLG